jgi:4-amino-4-deoxy-L-arabinose transferase-like glycosyltransferase
VSTTIKTTFGRREVASVPHDAASTIESATPWLRIPRIIRARRPPLQVFPRAEGASTLDRSPPERPRSGVRVRLLPALLGSGAVFNLGLLALYYVPAPKRLIGDENYYLGIGRAIAEGRPVQHDPFWPPVYGELIGICFSVFWKRILVVQILQIALWMATGFAFFRVVERLVPSRGIAYLALALFLFSPELAAFSHYLWPETVHLFFVTTGIYLLVCHGDRWTAIVGGGICFGLALLSKGVLLPMVPLVALFLLLGATGAVGATRRGLAAAIFAATTAALPLGTRIATRDPESFALTGSSIFSAWVGLNDTERVDFDNKIAGAAHEEFRSTGPDLATRNEVTLRRIRAQLRRQGLANTFFAQLGRQYFRLFDHQTYFTTQLPGGPRGTYAFEAPGLAAALRIHSGAMHALVLIAAAFGVSFLRFRTPRWPQFLAAFVACNLALYFVVHAVTRYVLQFLPMMIFFAAVALAAASRRIRGEPPLDLADFVFTRRRAAIGSILGVVMACLAFRSLLFEP